MSANQTEKIRVSGVGMDEALERPAPYSSGDIRQMKSAMRLSLLIGFFMLVIKMYAYVITGSTAILSDAAESVVHVIAVSFAAYSLMLSMKPADEAHPYGHDRIGFFSAGFEGLMIVLAALYIIYEAVHEWLTGLSIRNLDTGTLFIVVATAVNGGLGWYLVRQGKKHNSIVLEANGKHVLTDSWTSLGVIVGLLLVLATGWLPFDPILAIIVGANILWTGGNLLRRSIKGLMDEIDPETEKDLKSILQIETARLQIEFHGLRYRNAGNRLLVEFHLLFPDDLTIAKAHERATLIEEAMHKAFPNRLEIISHLEPIEGHDEVHKKILRSDKPGVSG
ncbi:MAG TPA: cation diffusion facilitator family transporter [Bacteroidota bacterium]|jgi:cation diffusion facilitator family transporter